MEFKDDATRSVAVFGSEPRNVEARQTSAAGAPAATPSTINFPGQRKKILMSAGKKGKSSLCDAVQQFESSVPPPVAVPARNKGMSTDANVQANDSPAAPIGQHSHIKKASGVEFPDSQHDTTDSPSETVIDTDHHKINKFPSVITSEPHTITSRIRPMRSLGLLGSRKERIDKGDRHNNKTILQSNAHAGLSRKNIYYFFIRLTWGRLMLVIAAVYAFLGILFGLTLLPVADSLVSGDGLTEYPPYSKCIISAYSSLISLGPAEIVPVSLTATTISLVHQFFGMLLGATLISILFNKFQVPKSDLIFSRKMLLTCRDGKTVLLFRIGNLRCNRIYLPDIRLSFFVPRKSQEGERYMTMMNLHLNTPPSIAGVHTACHIVDPSGPLGHLDPGDAASANLHQLAAFSVVIMGKDATLHDDIVGFHRYKAADIVIGYNQFADVIGVDSATGTPKVEFQFFHVAHQLPIVDVYNLQRPIMDWNKIYIVFGSLHWKSQLVKACVYTQKIELLLRKAQIHNFESIKISLKMKPSWFLQDQPEGTTPLMYHEGKIFRDTEAILKYLSTRFSAKVSALSSRDDISNDLINSVSRTMMSFLQTDPKCSLTDPHLIENASSSWLAMRVEFSEALSAIEKLLSDNDYLNGDAPGLQDVLWFPHLESSLEFVENMINFDPSTFPKIQRYRARMYVDTDYQETTASIDVIQALRASQFATRLPHCHWLQSAKNSITVSSDDTERQQDADSRGIVELCM